MKCPIHNKPEKWHMRGYFICPQCYENKKKCRSDALSTNMFEKSRSECVPHHLSIQDLVELDVHMRRYYHEPIQRGLIDTKDRNAPLHLPPILNNGFNLNNPWR